MERSQKERLDQPKKELARAKTNIEAMRVSKTPGAFEKSWKDFLCCLERSWYKLNNANRTDSSWPGWVGRYSTLREKDPLLAYLQNARHVEEHSIQPITTTAPGGVGIKPAKGDSLFIKEARIMNGKIWIQTPQQLKIVFIAAKTKLLPITNWGKTYPVPGMHLGTPIDPENVISVAELGLAFYQKLISEAETRFR
ncbi:MAG: hypothetical protein JW724_05350 [Candidatus Altiarchaeota archaeon]|nr:hypothetical protein [Candidatus Altiarchaeota archaeon]